MNRDKLATFYLVRHGQTDMNAAGLLQGQSDSKLIKKGKEQVTAQRIHP